MVGTGSGLDHDVVRRGRGRRSDRDLQRLAHRRVRSGVEEESGDPQPQQDDVVELELAGLTGHHRNAEGARRHAGDSVADHCRLAHPVPIPADAVGLDERARHQVVGGLQVEAAVEVALVERVEPFVVDVFVAEAERMPELVGRDAAGVEVSIARRPR